MSHQGGGWTRRGDHAEVGACSRQRPTSCSQLAGRFPQASLRTLDEPPQPRAIAPDLRTEQSGSTRARASRVRRRGRRPRGRERRLGLAREHAAPRRFTGKRLVRRMTNLGSAALLLAGSALGKTTFGGSGAFAGRQRFVSQDDWQPARGLRAPVRSSAADTPRGAPAHGRLRAHCGRASDGHRPGHHGSHRDRPDAGARPRDHDAGVARRRSGACSDWGGPTTRGRCACSAARSELTSGGGSDPRPAGRSGAGAG